MAFDAAAGLSSVAIVNTGTAIDLVNDRTRKNSQYSISAKKKKTQDDNKGKNSFEYKGFKIDSESCLLERIGPMSICSLFVSLFFFNFYSFYYIIIAPQCKKFSLLCNTWFYTILLVFNEYNAYKVASQVHRRM